MKNNSKSARISTKATLLPFFIWPRPLQRLFAYLLASFWYYILRMRVSLARSQAKRVFPDKSEREISKIVFKSFNNLILILFEYSYFTFSKKKE